MNLDSLKDLLKGRRINKNLLENTGISTGHIQRICPQTKIYSHADYRVIVSGNSMKPPYEDGDILFVESTNNLKNNDIEKTHFLEKRLNDLIVFVIFFYSLALCI